jgi:hypothetical protein
VGAGSCFFDTNFAFTNKKDWGRRGQKPAIFVRIFLIKGVLFVIDIVN